MSEQDLSQGPFVLISTVDMNNNPEFYRRVPLAVAKCSSVLNGMLEDLEGQLQGDQPPLLELPAQKTIYTTRAVDLDRIVEHTTRYLAAYQDTTKRSPHSKYDPWEETWFNAFSRRDRLLLLWAANYLDLPNLKSAASVLINNEQGEFLRTFRQQWPEPQGSEEEKLAQNQKRIYEQLKQCYEFWGCEDEIDFAEADSPRLWNEYQAELKKKTS